jgi:hypothetical protein
MKVTVEIPPPVTQRLRASVPTGKRPRFVVELISKRLQNKGSALEKAARKANALGKITRDIKAWKELNEHTK